MKDKQEYNAVNLKTLTMVFWLIISFAISAILFWFFTISDVIWFSVFTFVGSLFFPFIIYYSVTSKIILTSDSIIKKTIFGITELKYKDIKSFGAYNQIGNVGLPINEADLHRTEFFAQKFGFVSNRLNYNPNSFKQTGSIRFHIIGDIYETLKDRLEKKLVANRYSYVKHHKVIHN